LVLLAVLIGLSGYEFKCARRFADVAGGASGIMRMVGIHRPAISPTSRMPSRAWCGPMLRLLLGGLSGRRAALAGSALFGIGRELLAAATLLPGVVIASRAAPLLARQSTASDFAFIILAIRGR